MTGMTGEVEWTGIEDGQNMTLGAGTAGRGAEHAADPRSVTAIEVGTAMHMREDRVLRLV